MFSLFCFADLMISNFEFLKLPTSIELKVEVVNGSEFEFKSNLKFIPLAVPSEVPLNFTESMHGVVFEPKVFLNENDPEGIFFKPFERKSFTFEVPFPKVAKRGYREVKEFKIGVFLIGTRSENLKNNTSFLRDLVLNQNERTEIKNSYPVGDLSGEFAPYHNVSFFNKQANLVLSTVLYSHTVLVGLQNLKTYSFIFEPKINFFQMVGDKLGVSDTQHKKTHQKIDHFNETIYPERISLKEDHLSGFLYYGKYFDLAEEGIGLYSNNFTFLPLVEFDIFPQKNIGYSFKTDEQKKFVFRLPKFLPLPELSGDERFILNQIENYVELFFQNEELKEEEKGKCFETRMSLGSKAVLIQACNEDRVGDFEIFGNDRMFIDTKGEDRVEHSVQVRNPNDFPLYFEIGAHRILDIKKEFIRLTPGESKEIVFYKKQSAQSVGRFKANLIFKGNVSNPEVDLYFELKPPL